MRNMRPIGSIALLVLLAIPAHAALKYQYSVVRDGRYASTSTTTVLVDGKRWRTDSEHAPDEAVASTSTIRTAKGEVIALNARNQTWFRPKSSGGGISSMLFGYYNDAKASKVKVASPAPGRITFSYRITADVGPAIINGEVHGEIRVSDDPVSPDLPLIPLEIHAGIKEVDDLLQPEIAKLAGRGRTVELEVTRRIEDGVALHETTRISITEPVTVTADPHAFEIPSGYRYQEPVIGGPGA